MLTTIASVLSPSFSMCDIFTRAVRQTRYTSCGHCLNEMQENLHAFFLPVPASHVSSKLHVSSLLYDYLADTRCARICNSNLCLGKQHALSHTIALTPVPKTLILCLQRWQSDGVKCEFDITIDSLLNLHLPGTVHSQTYKLKYFVNH